MPIGCSRLHLIEEKTNSGGVNPDSQDEAPGLRSPVCISFQFNEVDRDIYQQDYILFGLSKDPQFLSSIGNIHQEAASPTSRKSSGQDHFPHMPYFCDEQLQFQCIPFSIQTMRRINQQPQVLVCKFLRGTHLLPPESKRRWHLQKAKSSREGRHQAKEVVYNNRAQNPTRKTSAARRLLQVQHRECHTCLSHHQGWAHSAT